jgi:hypothetical protein
MVAIALGVFSSLPAVAEEHIQKASWSLAVKQPAGNWLLGMAVGFCLWCKVQRFGTKYKDVLFDKEVLFGAHHRGVHYWARWYWHCPGMFDSFGFVVAPLLLAVALRCIVLCW